MYHGLPRILLGNEVISMNDGMRVLGLVVCLHIFVACGRPPESGPPNGQTTSATTRESVAMTTSRAVSSAAAVPNDATSTAQRTGSVATRTVSRGVPTV